jgi:transcription initiation factor TFIIH subunit 4
MPQVMVVARNFMDMVAALPASKLDMLYDSAFICEAVLRSLPPLAKKYVLQMLYVSAPVPAAAMEGWVRDEYAAKHKVAIDRLLQLRIFVEVRDRRKEVSYKMNQKFQSNMQNYLVDGGSLPRTPLLPGITGRLPTFSELEDYALDQWERFLLQLINSSQVEKGTTFSSSMMRIFQRGLLSSRDGDTPKLTENGFQFLLMETNAQLWYIMREYISSAEERGVDPTELISFLLELSFHTMGAAYSLTTLSGVQKSAIRDLAELGLVKLQQGMKDSWFLPTKLATNLSASLSNTSSSKEGFVVVETNFRMYAYSTSKLHCEILRLFSRVEYQLPNLIAGAITKESIYAAFENGITAENIISFLQQNAHPRVADKIPTVPENVTDQIRLWETDRNRVEMIPSHLYEDFPSKELFEQCCDHARDSGYLLWEDSKKMRLVVGGEFHPEMREFLRRQR